MGRVSIDTILRSARPMSQAMRDVRGRDFLRVRFGRLLVKSGISTGGGIRGVRAQAYADGDLKSAGFAGSLARDGSWGGRRKQKSGAPRKPARCKAEKGAILDL